MAQAVHGGSDGVALYGDWGLLMKNCSNCDYESVKQKRFCPNCGTEADSPSAPPKRLKSDPINKASEDSFFKPTRTQLKFLGVVAFSLVVFLVSLSALKIYQEDIDPNNIKIAGVKWSPPSLEEYLIEETEIAEPLQARENNRGPSLLRALIGVLDSEECQNELSMALRNAYESDGLTADLASTGLKPQGYVFQELMRFEDVQAAKDAFEVFLMQAREGYCNDSAANSTRTVIADFGEVSNLPAGIQSVSWTSKSIQKPKRKIVCDNSLNGIWKSTVYLIGLDIVWHSAYQNLKPVCPWSNKRELEGLAVTDRYAQSLQKATLVRFQELIGRLD